MSRRASTLLRCSLHSYSNHRRWPETAFFHGYYVRHINMGRVKPRLDERVETVLSEENSRAKLLNSKRKYGLVELPIELEAAARKAIKLYQSKTFRRDVSDMIKSLSSFKMPDDKYSIKAKISEIKGEIEVRDIESKHLARYLASEIDEDRAIAHCELKKIIEAKLQRKRRDWHYIEYDEYTAALYMAARLAPNYSAIRTVMDEIKKSDPEFRPRSVLDFGSGMGTTMWAVNDAWPDTTNEFLNVEISQDQSNLAEYLLRGGKEGKPVPGVFFRNYLPTSHLIKYDMVVCAYSLLDLPALETRVNIIENLWRKTNDLLVFIERGTKGGFNSVAEARHLVLDISGHDIAKKIRPSGELAVHTSLIIPSSHILAPCPHEFTCPRLSMTSKRRHDKCSFSSKFVPLEIGKARPALSTEYFSYVVLRKQPHPSLLNSEQSSIRWPRIVEPKQKSRKMVIHKLCCPNGHLAVVNCTAAKYGRCMQDTAKASDHGDLLPIIIDDSYGENPSLIEVKEDVGDGDKMSDQRQ